MPWRALAGESKRPPTGPCLCQREDRRGAPAEGAPVPPTRDGATPGQERPENKVIRWPYRVGGVPQRFGVTPAEREKVGDEYAVTAPGASQRATAPKGGVILPFVRGARVEQNEPGGLAWTPPAPEQVTVAPIHIEPRARPLVPRPNERGDVWDGGVGT